jgi:hypothetical protein
MENNGMNDAPLEKRLQDLASDGDPTNPAQPRT